MGSHTIVGSVASASRKTPSSHEEVRSVADDLRRIVQALRVSGTATEKALGLSGAQIFVLQQLAREPAPSVAALAERTFTHQSSVSVVVRRLVERKLVVRQTDPKDSRKVSLAITAAGRRALLRAPVSAPARLVEALRSLDASDRTALARGLGALVSAMEIPTTPPPLFMEDESPASPEPSPPADGPRKTSRSSRRSS